MGRVCHVGTGYGIIAKGYYMKLDDKGRCSLVITRGKENKKEKVGDAEQQALIAAMDDKTEGGEKILATADLTNGGVHASFALQWHSLKLRFDGDVITGYVDGREVVKATSAQYPRGMAGLMAPMQEQRISTPYFDNLEIVPIGRSAATPAMPQPDIRPLYK